MHEYSLAEVAMVVIGAGLTLAFGAWAAVVYRSSDKMEKRLESVAEAMGRHVERAVDEIAKLRQEIHQDRVLNERRFTRIEQIVGFREPMEFKD